MSQGSCQLYSDSDSDSDIDDSRSVAISYKNILFALFIVVQLMLFVQTLNLLNSSENVFKIKQDKQYVQAYLILSVLFFCITILAYTSQPNQYWKYILLPLLWIGCIVLGGLMLDSNSKKVKQFGVGILVGYSIMILPAIAPFFTLKKSLLKVEEEEDDKIFPDTRPRPLFPPTKVVRALGKELVKKRGKKRANADITASS